MRQKLMTRNVGAALLLPVMLGLGGCGSLLRSATQDFTGNLKQTLLNHTDPATVAEALPAYLLLLEASLGADADAGSLATLANLYRAYISLLPEQSPRKVVLSQRALDFAQRGACRLEARFCGLQSLTIAELQLVLDAASDEDLDSLYSIATAWAGWIEARKQDWIAIAQLAQVKAVMQRILALDASYQKGAPQLYLGVLESLVPASLGGKPDVAKQYFEEALRLDPNNLLASVLYAKHYARMAFDRELHDKLLHQVLATPVAQPGLTLLNTMAQQQAQQLLNSGNDFF